MVTIPRDAKEAVLEVEGREVRVTNTGKLFWPDHGITKGDLLQYYVDVAPALLPHITDRPMVMRRYPNGPKGPTFFMKRAPTPRPAWIETCSIEHGSGNVIDFPIISDLASLIWVVNLGCIDLNPWYSRKDDVDRPDFLHFDLDPGEAEWTRVCEAAQRVHEALSLLGMPVYVKTSGSKGLHIYVPIERGPLQKEVWTFAKALSIEVAKKSPEVATAEYKKAKRPPGRVLIDFNQNRWGSTLASIYSVRPHPRAAVSTPVSWEELARGITIEDFRIDNVPARVREKGDLWANVAPLAPGRIKLGVPPGPTRRLSRKKAVKAAETVAPDPGGAVAEAPASASETATTTHAGSSTTHEGGEPAHAPELLGPAERITKTTWPPLSLAIKPPYPPMEALLVKKLPAGEAWQFEPKWDGFRCLAYRDGKEIALQSKAGLPLARYFPEITASLLEIESPRFVIDAEILIPVGDSTSFDDLLMRIHPAASRVTRLSQEIPAVLEVFDILVQGDESFVETPLRERRTRLEAFFLAFMKGNARFILSRATTDRAELDLWSEELRGKGIDGIIAKRLDANYRSGERTGMQKFKWIRSADCVVGGFRYGTDSKQVGSLLLGLRDEEGLLHHVGFCSAIKREEKGALTTKLEALKKPPGFTGCAPCGPSRWATERTGEWQPLDPVLVVEVAYDHYSQGRFRHGTRFLRWRPDKPSELCTLDQVRPASRRRNEAETDAEEERP